MGRYFLDSSALAKLYHAEAGSDQVEALFQQSQRRMIISRLTAVENALGFCRKGPHGYVESGRCGSALWMLCNSQWLWKYTRRESLDAVVAADNVVCQVAAAEGFPVMKPEGPS